MDIPCLSPIKEKSMISGNKANGQIFHVDEILLINGVTRSDVEVAFFDDFIIVSGNGGEEPIFYNKSIVLELRGVRAIHQQAKSRAFYF